MYISKITIKNFRNFDSTEICLNDGLNILIGSNNSGKTNLLKALSLVIDSGTSKRLDIDDFNKQVSLERLKESSPKITISLVINKGSDDQFDDLVMVGNWLTKLDPVYEALLTYEFFLPEKEEENYLKIMGDIDDALELDKVWKIINRDFIRFYSYKIWGGRIENKTTADSDSLGKFDFQFLSAIRDVERDMLTGRNTLLRDIIDFFIDYDIKSIPNKTGEEKQKEIKVKQEAFAEKSGELIFDLQTRMIKGKEQILSYANDIGAALNNAKPNFEGDLSEVDLYSALRLIVEHETGMKIPATRNGLGYNNLIFMSLLLAKMQINSDGNYLGSNAKNFSVLAIEEPEAHLHPSMQFKFLKFLKDNEKVRQIFITSHSTHITSAVNLDELICLYGDAGKTAISYPGKVFPSDVSKKYIQRFLDATKSDMLFARKVILVEGLAEQLLISIFAKYLNISLEDYHVSIINIGGRYFDHFLFLFDSSIKYSLPKKVACITDRDPERKLKTDVNSTYGKCYPFEYGVDDLSYEYKNNIDKNQIKYEDNKNIRFFSQDKKYGNTLEYDLAFANPESELLLTDSIANKEEIKDLMAACMTMKLDEFLNLLRKGTQENQAIIESIKKSTWTEDEKKASIIAARYLNSISKGVNALELAAALEDNLHRNGVSGNSKFVVPKYIEDALNWVIS